MKTRRYPTRRCLNKIGDIKIFLSFLHPPPPPFLLQNPNTRGRHYIHTNIHIHIYICIVFNISRTSPFLRSLYEYTTEYIPRTRWGENKTGGRREEKKKKKEIRDGRPGVRVVEEGFTKVNAANNRRGRMDAHVEPEEARG